MGVTALGYAKISIVEKFTAGGTLKIGDVVFLSAARTVNKSTTAGDYAARIGIVVGGSKFYEQETSQNLEDVGETAAVANEAVWVCLLGVAYAVSEGGSTLGNKLMSGTTTAGTVKTGTTAGQVIGIALETVLTTAKFLMLVRPE